MEKLSAPKGTYDILPERAALWRELESKVHCIFKEYGFGEVRTPIFEHTELFQRGIGETTDIVEKEMFTFTDRGDRSITLRPEGTASAVRAFVEHLQAGPGILSKLYYLGPMFRCEAPQAGRYRQFVQFGAESIGSEDPRVDAEIIALAVNFYQRLGVRGLDVNLNSVGCKECRPRYREALIEYLKPKYDNLCPNCQRRLERNPLRLLDCKNPKCQEQMKDVPEITDVLCDDCTDHFTRVKHLLDLCEVKYRLNPRLVRGLDYYTKTVFEVFTDDKGSQSALCAGGRYDGLVEECGGKPTPGIGFAAGMERLLLVLEAQGLLPQTTECPHLYLAPLGEKAQEIAFLLCIKLRENGWNVATDLQGRSLKAQMKTADKLGAPLVGVLGEDECANAQIMMRRMENSEQELISLGELDSYLTKIYK